jgi:hypothetical protein
MHSIRTDHRFAADAARPGGFPGQHRHHKRPIFSVGGGRPRGPFVVAWQSDGARRFASDGTALDPVDEGSTTSRWSSVRP